jgi:hypothetical protein
MWKIQPLQQPDLDEIDDYHDQTVNCDEEEEATQLSVPGEANQRSSVRYVRPTD